MEVLIQTLDPSASSSMTWRPASAALIAVLSAAGCAARRPRGRRAQPGYPPRQPLDAPGDARRTVAADAGHNGARPGQPARRSSPRRSPPSALPSRRAPSRAREDLKPPPGRRCWTYHYAQKSTRVGASIRPDYRPAANAEEDGAGTMLTLEMLDEALRNNLRMSQSAVV